VKADDGHFEYRRIVYFVVQITTDFLCHITKCDASFVLQTFRELRNDHVVTQEIQQLVVTIKNNTILQSAWQFYVIMKE